jgi:predicted dehydrogenase
MAVEPVAGKRRTTDISRPSRRARRRDFLKAAAATVACPLIIRASALGGEDRPPPSDRIVMGGIGIGSMGSGDLGAFLGRGDVQYLAVCDVKREACERAKQRVDERYGNTDCQAYADFREMLARDDLDAVHVGTPDHWHALIVIGACRAGKDVYCQKPETLTLREGSLMVQAARRYGRVVSGGSQRVLEDYRKAVESCWSGELGTIKSINVNVGGPSRSCYLPGEPVPDGLDWDRWLGPAPWAPYHPYRISGSYSINGTSWRSWSDYSGGSMTDWGAHHIGGATFAADVREMQPVEVLYPDGQDVKCLTWRFPNGLLMYHNGPDMENLQVVSTPDEKLPPKTVPAYKGEGGIYGDFIECVKTREKPFRDIELAVNTMSVCHLGIIAYQLKRSLKWDPEKQEFPGDEQANRLVDRARREPWIL